MSSVSSCVGAILLVVVLATSSPVDSSIKSSDTTLSAAGVRSSKADLTSSSEDDLKADSTLGIGFGFGLPLAYSYRYPSYYGSYGYYNPYHYHYHYGYPYYSYRRYYTYDSWPYSYNYW